jgi:Tfp pilus assembly protein PilV
VRFAGGPGESLVLDGQRVDELAKLDMSKRLQERKGRRQAGFTVLEAMIAGFILTFGLLAITALFATAIGNNGRSRVDTTATMLSESVIEQITAVLARGGPSAMTDCAPTPTTWFIDTNVGGAALTGSSIDFTESSPPSGYYMNFVVCNGGGEANTQATYDVRWHVAQISTGTYLVTVAARPQVMSPGRFTFSLPVTFRTYVGPQ